MLKTAAEEALSLVPVAGPVLNIGVGLAQNLADEFAKDRDVSVEDVARALHKLPFSEAQRIADDAMASQAGMQALRGLSDAERAGVHHQLVGLPTTLEDMLQEIGRRESVAAQAAVETAAREAHQARLAALSRHAELHRLLVGRLDGGDYKAAYKLIDEILAIERRDALALKAQRFIDHRTGRRRLLPRVTRAFVIGAILAAAVPALGWATQAPAEVNWHLSDGSRCDPYQPSPFTDPCVRDPEPANPFPTSEASLIAGIGGGGLALVVGVTSTWLYTRRLVIIWIGSRRRRLARAP